MIHILKLKLIQGLTDAKFLFLAALMLIAFFLNGFTFAEKYATELDDYRTGVAETYRLMQGVTGNLQEFAIFEQRVMLPPAKLSFIVSGGRENLPNGQVTSALATFEKVQQHRSNKAMPSLPALDWLFIIGVLGSLLAIVSGYSVFAEERRYGTFRQVMSNPVSRLSVFFGSYFGLMIVLTATMLAGVVINVSVLTSFGGPSLTQPMFFAIGQAFLYSLLYLSAFLFLSLAVSATTREPTVSLVTMLAVWIIAVVAVPGLSQLIVEQVTTVRGNAEEQQVVEARIDELRANAGPGHSDWSGDPFADFVPNRAAFRSGIMNVLQEESAETHRQKVAQLKLCQRAAVLSPYGAMRDGLLSLSGTGVYSMEQLDKMVNLYQNILYEYVVGQDAREDTPHLVYGMRRLYDKGVFSNKSISFESIPKAEVLWEQRQDVPALPLWHWVLVVGFNLIFGFLALIMLMRLDPR